MINRRAPFLVGGVLAALFFVFVEQQTFAAEPPSDPLHAAHVAAGTMPAKGDPALSQQLSQLQAKVAQLEAALAKNSPPPATAAIPAAALPGMAAPTVPIADMAAPPAPMESMSGTVKPAGMGGMAAAPAGANMMGMMDKMMGMMDKMMSMGGAAMPTGAPMAGGGMKSEMGGMGGTMPAVAPAAAMSGGGMGMEKMEMSGMMGMSMSSAAGTMAQSALPGYPGASHLYHIGATGFFLDHPQHIVLTTEQQATLNKAKEQALLAKSTSDRAVEQAEQALWTLTAADQPDATQIEAKIREIEKLHGDERLSFIRAVGDATKFLTEDQRKVLTGFAPVTPAAAAAPMVSGMKGM